MVSGGGGHSDPHITAPESQRALTVGSQLYPGLRIRSHLSREECQDRPQVQAPQAPCG